MIITIITNSLDKYGLSINMSAILFATCCFLPATRYSRLADPQSSVRLFAGLSSTHVKYILTYNTTRNHTF